ncbi:MAG: HPP family protein [Marinoscillum sp.]
MQQKIKRNIRIARYVLYKETLVNFHEHFWSFIGSFVGIGILSFLHYAYFSPQDAICLIGSFGASSVLVYGAIQSPLAQPRNLIGGHVFSAIVGVAFAKLLPGNPALAAPFAVSLSIIGMQITRTLHPPGGATALIAVMGSDSIQEMGWWYVLFPVLSGTLILFMVALIFNNITVSRCYPTDRRFTRIFKRSVMIGR